MEVMKRKMTRRQFLKVLALAGGAVVTAVYKLLKLPVPNGIAADNADDEVYLPLITNNQSTPMPEPTPTSPPPPTPIPGAPTVIHVRNEAATSWTGSPSNYWDYVNQSAIDTMVDAGMFALTGTSTRQAAWQAILPNYQLGEKIAIKVSFNNTTSCSKNSTDIDSIIEPVNAVIRGLLTIPGVTQPDIWVYDASRGIPVQFRDDCPYNVRYFDAACSQTETATFNSDNPHASIVFSEPAVPRTNKVTDVLIDADYLINIPIMKIHGNTSVSLAMKNHFGSINNPSDIHPYITRFISIPDYDAIVDVYRNPQIHNKTVLTVADGIFSAMNNFNVAPTRWSTLGNQYPTSLFFSRDSVAIDCVMTDMLKAEHPAIVEEHVRFLHLAEDAGLGTYERETWANGRPASNYTEIDYIRIDQ